MSNSAVLGALEYEAETVFGEDVVTFATLQLPVLDAIDVSGLVHEKQEAANVVAYRNDGNPFIKMTQNGSSFKTKLYLCGNGSTMVGSPTISPIATFLGRVFGNAVLSATASTPLTGGTSTVPITTASATFSAGGLCRIGTLADLKGGGQMYPIASHLATNLTVLSALIGTPAAADVLYPVAMVYGNELATAGTVGSVRFRALGGNLSYEMHGCYPTAVSITGVNTGQVPTIEITWGVAWWRYTTTTLPSSAPTSQTAPAPIAAGSLCVNVVGTTTRNPRIYRDLTIEYAMNVAPLMGPGGVNAYQSVVGARRLPDTCTLSWTEDADTVTLTPVLPGYGTGTSEYYFMYTGSATDGSAFGFFCPRIHIANIPTQVNDGGINRLKISAKARTGPTKTTELTSSFFRMGLA
jgi:hypothetical protein